MPKICIVGAVALGPKAACRIRRLDPEAEITLIDREAIISYGGCGIPYFLSGDIPDSTALRSTIYHALRDEKFFDQTKRVTVRTQTDCLSIDRAARTIRVRDLVTGAEEDLPYDALVLGMGSRSLVPPVPGTDLPGVTTIGDLPHAEAVKDRIAKGLVESAVIVGAGAIGLEAAEAMTALWGVRTTVLEMRDQVLPGALSPDMAGMVASHMREQDVAVHTGCALEALEAGEDGNVAAAVTSAGRIPCQLVIFAAGVRPNGELAAAAGLAMGPRGGVLVDETMRTSDPDIFAGGDCAEIKNLITGDWMFLPLGSMANRQGRVIGTNAAGGDAHFPGAVGSFILKAFEMSAGKAGLTPEQARQAGFDPADALVSGTDWAHFYPGKKPLYLRLTADRTTRKVLGFEAVGFNGDAVKARVDAVAAAMCHGAVVEDISNLEVAYAPPFASAMDVVNTAANVCENIIEGRAECMTPDQFVRTMEGAMDNDVRVLDVRSADFAEPFIARYGDRWQCIPQDQLPGRLDEVPSDEPLIVFCNTGTRSFECQVLLRQKGFGDTRNVQGGAAAAKAMNPEFFAALKK